MGIRSQFSIVLGRIQKELKYVPSIALEAEGILRQQIMLSRSFGTTVAAFGALSE